VNEETKILSSPGVTFNVQDKIVLGDTMHVTTIYQGDTYKENQM
jgi:hypothetical protein